MESPVNDLQFALSNKIQNYNNENNYDIKETKIKESQTIDRMTNSGASLLDDTPTDSGVQLLDSESSELNESLISSGGFEFDSLSNTNDMNKSLNQQTDDDVDEKIITNLSDLIIGNENNLTDNNLNIINKNDVNQKSQNTDELISSTHSAFDAENIVYRRRAKKTKNHTNAPKKRVSFHEDILKNTKTDNIHIEHGFITYKNNAKKNLHIGRYSWCSEGDDYNDNNHHVYRNACSDVLDYGKTEIYENTQTSNYIHYDNSGVFEYGPKSNDNKNIDKTFYKCNSSDSNSSLDSGSSQSDENSQPNYVQAKSNSCECIGGNANNNNLIITENCYYSEPSFEILDENNIQNNKPKSVWSKDKKPKSSCLKKSKRHTDILLECDLNKKVKKFNVHPLSDMNNLIDNSKMIFGSLKNIFSIPLPERGVPEGSEDLQSVCECIPENESNMNQKSRSSLSKSLDGGIKDIKGMNTKTYIHNVDAQLRRKNDNDLFAPTRQNSRDFVIVTNEIPKIENVEKEIELEDNNDDDDESTEIIPGDDVDNINFQKTNSLNYRNKFIINCESTVFEHTGVSFCYEKDELMKFDNPVPSVKQSTLASTPGNTIAKTSSFSALPFKQKISNMFKNLTESETVARKKNDDDNSLKSDNNTGFSKVTSNSNNIMDISFTSSCSDKESTFSDLTTTTSTTTTNTDQLHVTNKQILGNASLNSTRRNRHLASPLRKKTVTTRYERSRMSPDLFNNASTLHPKTNKSILLAEEFDDILTITTTDTDKNESDIVIVDYSSSTSSSTQNNTNNSQENSNNCLKPAQSKTSLINRFLRNVTQKKIMDASIKRNNTFITKLKTEQKLFENLYVKNVKIPTDKKNLIADFNAEIAMEMELSLNKTESKPLEIVTLQNYESIDTNISNTPDPFKIAVGEISIDIFSKKYLNILRSDDEILMKAFKLYTGYNHDGYMTPVLVFLTDKTIYVTDLVRNRLCNKFVLPYTDLDVILMGPYGNTVLLSNGTRDMQQVLLAGGPYPADGLVSSLEICARRGGFILPAVGQLTLDHLTPLQAFVCDNSSISKSDHWMYYAVVNVPAGSLNSNPEPMGPHIKGPLMHRNLCGTEVVQSWQPGYFLLKAGVLYNFHDVAHKIPTWAIALHECQGARRLMTAARPHCFELLLKTGLLQLAAPDEYVASEWLQALVQAASGLFEMQEKHSTLGCTIIMTPNHLITLREDFSAPLRRLNVSSPSKENIDPNESRKFSKSFLLELSSEVSSISSNVSTPTKNYEHRSNSNLSTPTKTKSLQSYFIDEKSYTTMSSLYGKNSGVEILTCAALDEMVALKVSARSDNWWCILEFSCQEVRENSDDLVVFFATNAELQRFLTMLETLWNTKNNHPFPISIVHEDDYVGEHCTKLFTDILKSWEPLLSAALGFPQ